MTLHNLNILPGDLLKKELFKCCGSTNWVNKMVRLFPMDDLVELLEDAEEQWYECTAVDWLEAFTQHPKIGDMDSLANKSGTTAQWAAAEQGSINNASQQVIADLVEGNKAYEKKFNYIFIVYASGKTAEEMLSLLKQRLFNSPDDEIKIAMAEQNNITLFRLKKLLQ